MDPLALLTQALSSKDPALQQSLLANTLRSLEDNPVPIPQLSGYLLPHAGVGQDRLLITGLFIDVLEIGACRSSLPVEVKVQLALQTVETLSLLLIPSTGPRHLKLLIQIITSFYPLLFRYMCHNKTNTHLWNTLTTNKNKITSWATSGRFSTDARGSAGQPVGKGVRIQAIKFLQRVVLVQSRNAGNDPRLNASRNDPNLAMVPSDHPFIQARTLEQEGVKLIEFILTTMYTCRETDILTSLLTALSTLIRLRPHLSTVFIPALTGWTPDFLADLPRSEIRSVEKVIRALMVYLERANLSPSLKPTLLEALQRQQVRMDVSYREGVKETRAQKRQFQSIQQPSLGPSSSDPSLSTPDHQPLSFSKRARLDTEPAAPSALVEKTAEVASQGVVFDVTKLPVELVIELVIANLQVTKEDVLLQAVRDVRTQLTSPTTAPLPTSISLLSKAIIPQGRSAGGAITSTGEVEAEIDESSADAVNPLDRTSPEDEEDSKIAVGPSVRLPATKAEDPSRPSAGPVEFSIPPPRPISSARKLTLVLNSLRRIWEAGQASSFQSAAAAAMVVKAEEPSGGEGEVEVVGTASGGVKMWELWMVLLARLVTRGKDEERVEDPLSVLEMRKALSNFVVDDFTTRSKFATLWLNEEWYNDTQITPEGARTKPHYRSSLLLLMNTYLPQLSGTSLIQFVLDLPEIPSEVLQMVQTLCVEADRAKGRVGMKILKDLTVERPPVRQETMEILLELCTHPDVNVRNPAIATVRLWVPDTEPMAALVKTFALHLLRCLRTVMKSLPKKEEGTEMEVDGPEEGSVDEKAKKEEAEEGEEEEEVVRSRYLPDRLEAPVPIDVVRQHVELLFALTKKVPDFLDEIFNSYVYLEPSVQEAFEQIVTPLIRSLGPSHGKLLTVLRKFPIGADALALRTVQLLTESKDEKTKTSAPLVALVKSLVAERELSPRFMLPILPELDKAEVRKQLPRLISILGGKAPERDLVRQIFSQILTTPPQAFFADGNGHVARLKASEQLSPAELMVLLHHCEKESGLKPTMEAIDLCFSMTDVYRSEILAVVMQQIVDEPELPTLFVRTVIKSVQTYKSLTGFVSTSLLSRLITKKIWTSPQPWEGFVRCAKVLGMASYGALLQLPREQLKEIVSRSDGKALKVGLREFVLKKAGGNTNRLPAWFPEVFAEDPTTPPVDNPPERNGTASPAPPTTPSSLSQ